jgi:hypothetical protein
MVYIFFGGVSPPRKHISYCVISLIVLTIFSIENYQEWIEEAGLKGKQRNEFIKEVRLFRKETAAAPDHTTKGDSFAVQALF